MQDKSRQRIREAAKAWRSSASRMQKQWEYWAREELPPDWWLEVWRYIAQEHQRIREHIRHEYGLEVQQPEWLEQLLIDVRRKGASQEEVATLILALAPFPIVNWERFAAQVRSKEAFLYLHCLSCCYYWLLLLRHLRRTTR